MKTYIFAIAIIVYVLLLSINNENNFLYSNIFLLGFLYYVFFGHISTRLSIYKLNFVKSILFISVFLNLIVHYNNTNASTLFIFVFWSLFIFFDKPYLKDYYNPRLMIYVVFFVILYSFIGLDSISLNDQMLRFHGFTGTATTFSTIVLTLYVFGLYTSRNKILLISLFSLSLLLIIASQTRTSLLLFLLLNLIYFFRGFIKTKYLKIFYILSLVFVLSMPVVSAIFSANSMSEMISRGEDGEDASLTSRNYFYLMQFNALVNMDFADVVFGTGINKSLFIDGDLDESDPHNDFFKLVFDYGVLYLIAFFIFIRQKIVNLYTLSIVIIYFFSFYHNMMYSVFFILFVNIDIKALIEEKVPA